MSLFHREGRPNSSGQVFVLGSIRPYLVAARKWYSEADAGPGAEAGAGFRD